MVTRPRRRSLLCDAHGQFQARHPSRCVDILYPRGYTSVSTEIRKTEIFAQWLDALRDVHARARIQARIERLADGNPGDVRPVGEGVSEMRIDYGPGYRVYFRRTGRELIILLVGGDKSTQVSDIRLALRLASEL